MDHVLWIDGLGDDATAIVGSKVANLAKLRRMGLRVPDGFAVSTGSYERFCRESGVAAEIESAVATIDPRDDAAVESASAVIRAAFAAATMPSDIAADVTEAYDELAYRCRDMQVPVAVRSSATGEDGCNESFAGQFDTYLGLSGTAAVLDGVQRCWGSLFTARALQYRLKNGLDYRQCPMAVGVIELVQARASGIAFSIHPVTGKRDRVVIESSWGWGEAVVQGVVTPDHTEICKEERRILSHQISDKRVVSHFDYSAACIVEGPMPERFRKTSALSDDEIIAIVDAVLAIEARFGAPVDVEWVVDRNHSGERSLSIVQARPETVHSNTVAPKVAWDPVAFASKYAFSGRR
jgi:pyruvate,water dikinase